MLRMEIRRHVQRQDKSDNASHLSQEGVSLARRIGEGSSGPFDLVLASSLPRAIETAIAMGFAVDEIVDDLRHMDSRVETEIPWDAGYGAWSDAYGRGGAVREYADALAARLRISIEGLAGSGSVLIISHGGIVEACAIGLAPDSDHRSWGELADYGEGVRLEFEPDQITRVEVLRAS